VRKSARALCKRADDDENAGVADNADVVWLTMLTLETLCLLMMMMKDDHHLTLDDDDEG
jgi:hypothetical protein